MLESLFFLKAEVNLGVFLGAGILGGVFGSVVGSVSHRGH